MLTLLTVAVLANLDGTNDASERLPDGREKCLACADILSSFAGWRRIFLAADVRPECFHD
jgi:hypothetical protein